MIVNGCVFISTQKKKKSEKSNRTNPFQVKEMSFERDSRKRETTKKMHRRIIIRGKKLQMSVPLA